MRTYENIHNAESVTRIIYAWQIISHNKTFQIELRLANHIGCINFVPLKISHMSKIYRFLIFSFTKNYSI